MTYEIRPLEKADFKRVCEIYEKALNEGKSTFQTEVPTFEAWDKSHLKKCRFVLTKDSKIIGWCALSPTSARKAYEGVAEVSIYISDEFRGKGFGTRLLEHLCKESRNEGYWSLYSAVFQINETSIALHKKCGFREVGYREKIAKDRFGNWQNTVIMEYRNDIE